MSAGSARLDAGWERLIVQPSVTIVMVCLLVASVTLQWYLLRFWPDTGPSPDPAVFIGHAVAMVGMAIAGGSLGRGVLLRRRARAALR